MSSSDSSTSNPTLGRLVAARSDTNRLAATLLGAVLVGSVACMLAYVLSRALQPYPLDAFEEYELHNAVRWRQGDRLYPSPYDAVFPTAYPPLHIWVLGCWTAVFGESFASPRALSLVAFFCVSLLAVWELRKTTRQPAPHLFLIATLLSMHQLTGKWFELCKADSLLMLFLAVAMTNSEHRSRNQMLLCSVSLWLASLTKQNAPIFLLPICVALVLQRRRAWAITWGLLMSGCIAGTYLAIDRASEGGFFHWVFFWTGQHGIDVARGIRCTWEAVWQHAPWLAVLVVLSLVRAPKCRWTWFLITGLVVAIVGMSKFGGLRNHLLPAAFAASVLAGRWFNRFWDPAAGSTLGGAGQRFRLPRLPLPGWCVRPAVLAAVLLMLLPALPTRTDWRWLGKRRQEASRWIEAVRGMPGPVAVSHHFLLARAAGADCFFSDLIWKFPNLAVPASVSTPIRSRQYGTLILCSPPAESATSSWQAIIRDHYEAVGELDSPDVSGVLPRLVYRRREQGRLGLRPGGLIPRQ